MFTQWVFSGLLLVAGCSSKSNQPMVSLGSVQSEGDPLEHDLQRIWSALPGEYSNHEQVLQQQYAGEEPYKELHHVFVPLEMPRIGKHVLFVQQHMKGMEKPYRTRLYHLVADTERSAIRLDIYKLANEAQWYNSFNEPAHLRELSENAEFERIEGCSVFWTRSETGFKGHTKKGACGFWSEQRKQTILVEDNLTLNDDVLTIQDVARDPDGNVVFGHPDGPPHINRRLRYFGGWAVVREGGPNYDRDAPEWRVHRGLKLHSEGGQIELLDAGGDPIPYRIELARLTRSSSQTHLLKLALVDIDTDKTVAYTWTDPNTERIGMNIGWAQVGLTAHGVSPHFGFDSEETSTMVSTLADHLSGVLTSKSQAQADDSFRAIRLHTCRVQAPGIGTSVLYVEQATEENTDNPYRQRLYHLEETGPNRVKSSIFTLNEPKDFVGLCQEKSLRFIHPSEATPKEGCAVEMTHEEGTFRGSTQPGVCPSALRGASYATAEVVITSEGIDALDRGYDETGTQVWGSENGPYQFRHPRPVPTEVANVKPESSLH